MNGTHHFYPTAHGDWYVIDGQLVDKSQAEANAQPAVTGSDVDSDPSPISLPPSPDAPPKRRNPKPED